MHINHVPSIHGLLDQTTKFTTNQNVQEVADENATELSLIDYSTCTLTAADEFVKLKKPIYCLRR